MYLKKKINFDFSSQSFMLASLMYRHENTFGYIKVYTYILFINI